VTVTYVRKMLLTESRRWMVAKNVERHIRLLFLLSSSYTARDSNSGGGKELFTPIENPDGGQCVIFTSHLHLASRLRMCGAKLLPPNPLLAFMAWTRTALPCYICSHLSPSADERLHFAGCSDVRK
jgi:hypothetical protein